MLVELLRWNQIHAILRSCCISVGLRPTCHGQTTADRHGRHAANVQRKGCLYLILYILVVDICGRFISNWHQLSLNHCPKLGHCWYYHMRPQILDAFVPLCSIVFHPAQPRRRYSCSFRKSTSTLSAEGQTNGHGATLSLKQWPRQSHHCDFRSARWCYVSMPVGHPKKPVAISGTCFCSSRASQPVCFKRMTSWSCSWTSQFGTDIHPLGRLQQLGRGWTLSCFRSFFLSCRCIYTKMSFLSWGVVNNNTNKRIKWLKMKARKHSPSASAVSSLTTSKRCCTKAKRSWPANPLEFMGR